MAFPWAPLALWGVGQAASYLFGKKEPGKPEKPEMGKFEPYTVPWDTAAFQQKLKLYGQEQQKGIYERAAAKGTLAGAGGTMPGEIGLAQTQQMAMAEYIMQMEQQEMLAKYQQYLQYTQARYGIQSKEYEMVYNEYMTRLQGLWSGQAEFGRGLGEMAGTWLGAELGKEKT